MNRIDKYFNKLINLNAVQLSMKPENPITYIMSSGKKFYDEKKPEQKEIEKMLQEIINDKIENIPEQKEVEYEIPEKATFSGLIEKHGESLFSSFILLERTEKYNDENEKDVEEETNTKLLTNIKINNDEPKINEFLNLLIRNKGSDLHLSSEEYLFLRKNEKLIKVKDLPILSEKFIRKMVDEIITKEERKKLNNLEELDFSYEIENKSRFRCNIFRDNKGLGAVFRLIPYRIPSFQELNLPKVLKDLCFLNRGLILVTGPTGSGKSTTLATMLDFINRKRNVHIITLEDPIEFVHKSLKALINQREIKKHTISFSSALKAALREDPDVVLVGEMRDLETIATAMETAETGHLVLATLHTTSAYRTVNRIIEQFPHDQQEQIKTMLADSLKAVCSQTLCRKIGGGRIAAFEILLSTPAVSNLIREDKTYQITSIIQTKKKEGMFSLNDYLMKLVDNNMIETYEAYINAVDKKSIIASLKSNDYKIDFLSRLDLLQS